MLCTTKSNRATKMVQVRYSLNVLLYQEGARIIEVLYSRRDTRSTSPVSARSKAICRSWYISAVKSEWVLFRTKIIVWTKWSSITQVRRKLLYKWPVVRRLRESNFYGREFEGRHGVTWILPRLQAREILQQRRSRRSGFAFCKSLVSGDNKIWIAWRVAEKRRYMYCRTMETWTAELPCTFNIATLHELPQVSQTYFSLPSPPLPHRTTTKHSDHYSPTQNPVCSHHCSSSPSSSYYCEHTPLATSSTYILPSTFQWNTFTSPAPTNATQQRKNSPPTVCWVCDPSWGGPI